MEQAPPPRGPAPLIRRAAIGVGGLGVTVAAVLGVGTPAWIAGGLFFTGVGLSKFPFYRPSRWRLAQATGPWWAAPGLFLMMTVASFSVSGVFHSLGLLIRAVVRSAAA